MTEKRLEYHRQWRAKNRDKVIEACRKWREANPGYYGPRSKRYRAEHPGKAAQYAKQWAAENIEAKKAHQAVQSALSTGKLQRGPCQRCGKPDSHAHHTDYAKPLDVTWLCESHHKLEHSKLRKEKLQCDT